MAALRFISHCDRRFSLLIQTTSMKDELAKRLVQSLKDAGINFVTYLPETRLSQIVPLIRDDPTWN